MPAKRHAVSLSASQTQLDVENTSANKIQPYASSTQECSREELQGHQLCMTVQQQVTRRSKNARRNAVLHHAIDDTKYVDACTAALSLVQSGTAVSCFLAMFHAQRSTLTCQDNCQEHPIVFFSATRPGDKDGLPRVGPLLMPHLMCSRFHIQLHQECEEGLPRLRKTMLPGKDDDY